jgi:hypothetical protein
MELDFETVSITVGNVNRSPVFAPVGTQSVLENELLQFSVNATDPDGDALAFSTGPLPVGASFAVASGTFSWRPDSTQAGTYVVSFYATDSGSPPMTGQSDVVVTVGDVPSPCELVDRIVDAVVGLNLPKSVENSYMANLKKVCRFVEEGKVEPAVNQVEAFVGKVRTHIQGGKIGEAEGNNLISMATYLIDVIGG